jgi:hypothetical protein
MSSQPNDLERSLQLLKSLPKAMPTDEFEEKLFERLKKEPSITEEKEASKWIVWSVAALIALAVTNVVVLSQQTGDAEEIDFLLVETIDEEYYYGQELLAIDEP